MVKASDETINKKYAEYKQRELNEKGEKTGKAIGKHVINLYSTGISQWLKINDVKKLRQGIEMADLGCLFVCTFGNYLAPVLIAVHTANSVDFGDDSDGPATQHEQNEDYEREGP